MFACAHTGALVVTAGNFRSAVLPLLPRSSVFHCGGSEARLSDCYSSTTESEAALDECVREDVGVICQGLEIVVLVVLVYRYSMC